MPPVENPLKLIHGRERGARSGQRENLSGIALDLFGFGHGIAMTDLHQKLSAWARRYKRWDPRETDSGCSEDRAPRASERQMCAMEVELRAMNAKADTSFDDAVAALRRADRPRG
jgi:hypothetical protein